MGEQSILEYRVTSLEDKLETLTIGINSKLDNILSSVQQLDKQKELGAFEIKTLEGRQDKAELAITDLQNKWISVQITLAEKIGPGSIAGGVVSVVILLINHFLGGAN